MKRIHEKDLAVPGRRGSRAIRRRVSIAVVLAVALAGALSACGVPSDTLGEASETRVAGATSGAALLRQANLDIMGAVAERRAGEKVFHDQVQGPLRICMARAGFAYRAPAFVDIYGGMTDDLLASEPEGRGWFIPLGSVGSLTEARQSYASAAAPLAAQADRDVAAAPDAYDNLTPQRRASYNAALGTCMQNRVAADGANFPQRALELNGQLDRFLANIEGEGEVKAARGKYADCMRQAGRPADPPAELFESLTSAPAAPASAAEREAVASARSASVADATCRKPVYDAGMKLVSSRLPSWLNSHAQDVAEVRKGWTQIVDAASKLS